MSLELLKPAKGSNKKSKKIGRGNGNGHGRTSCRGSNGANSRSGAKRNPRFEGGQMPLQRRLPKRGFSNFFALKYDVINLGDIQKFVKSGDVVDAVFLVKVGLLSSLNTSFKVLANGDFTSPVTFKVSKISKSAEDKIAKVGGSVEIL